MENVDNPSGHDRPRNKITPPLLKLNRSSLKHPGLCSPQSLHNVVPTWVITMLVQDGGTCSVQAAISDPSGSSQTAQDAVSTTPAWENKQTSRSITIAWKTLTILQNGSVEERPNVQPCTLGNIESILHDQGDATFTLRIMLGLPRQTGDEGILCGQHSPATCPRTCMTAGTLSRH